MYTGLQPWISAITLALTVTTLMSRPLNIVATTPELGALTSALAGDRARIRTITTGREDPHFLQARPTFTVMARDADLWLRMGLELEIGWEPVLIESSRNPRIRVGQPGHFDAGAYIAYALEVPEATATRAQGDVHPSGNPHYLTDPLNARTVAKALAERLMVIDPAHSDHYRDGLAAFLERLDRSMFGAAVLEKIDAERLWAAEVENGLLALLKNENATDLLGGWRGAMQPWRDQPVITFHKSWSYLAHRFGFLVVAELEPLPGVPPSPVHLTRIIDLMRQKQVTLILREPFYPERPARFVARATGARVVTVNSYGTDSSTNGYFTFIDSIIGAFQP